MFGVEDTDYAKLKKFLVELLPQSKMDYTAAMSIAADLGPSDTQAVAPKEAIRRRRKLVARVHRTIRGNHCDHMQRTTV